MMICLFLLRSFLPLCSILVCEYITSYSTYSLPDRQTFGLFLAISNTAFMGILRHVSGSNLEHTFMLVIGYERPDMFQKMSNCVPK